MFRIRVAASLFVIMAALSAGLFVYLGDHAEGQATDGLERQVTVARSSLERSRRLTDHWILARARQVAAWPQMGGILSIKPESMANEEGTLPEADAFDYQIHVKMNEEVLVWMTKFQALADGKVKRTARLADWRTELPDYFVVFNEKGVSAADAKDRAGYGTDLSKEHPVVRTVIDTGDPVVDVWFARGAPMVVGVAPVLSAGRVVGGVIIGYRLTSSEAKIDQRAVGAEVAYFVGDALSQSSSLRPGVERDLQAKLVADTLVDAAGKDPIEITLEGRRWLAAVARNPAYVSARDAGYVVLVDADAALAAAEDPMSLVWAAGALAFLLSLVSVLLAFLSFVRPIEAVDQGVMEIINGNLEYWFDGGKKELVGTMAQNLNIMVCNLSGRPLPDEDEG